MTPAAAYIEQGLAAAEQVFGPGQHGLANVAIQQAMFLPEGVRRRVQVSVAPESGGESTFETYSRTGDENGCGGCLDACMLAARWCMNRSWARRGRLRARWIESIWTAARDRAVTILSRESSTN